MALTLISLTGGESLLNLPAVVELPLYSDGQQLFPFRTAIMMISLLSHLLFSWLSYVIFAYGWLDLRYDVLRCFTPDSEVTVDIPLNGACNAPEDELVKK